MRRADFGSYPFPEDLRILLALCQLAIIAEEAIDLVYTRRAPSIRDLHSTAERLHAKLRDWGHAFGVGNETAEAHQTVPLAPVASLLLHTCMGSPCLFMSHTNFVPVYFHSILLLFRPFMIAESSVDGISHLSSELWLRKACRRATDTAQDAICILNNIMEQSEDSRVGTLLFLWLQ